MAGKLSKMFYSLSARKPNGDTHYGMSKLCAAIYYRKFDKAEVLLDAGADPNALNGEKWAPVLMAVAAHDPENKYAERKTALAQQIIECGGDLDLRNPHHGNQTQIQMAMTEADQKAADPDRKLALDVAQKLLALGANPDVQADDGRTALLTALDENCLAVAAALIESGADVNIADNTGRRPAHVAAEKGYADILAALAEKGADLSAQDREGWTARDRAYSTSNNDAVKALLADKNAPYNMVQPAGRMVKKIKLG